MHNRTLFVLFLFVFALGIYYYTGQYTKLKEQAKQERAAARIFPFESGEAGKAGWIRSGDRGEIVLEKRDGHWRVSSPVAAEADGDAVGMALAALSETDRNREIDPGPAEPEALKQYGLDEPHFEIWVDGAFDTDTIRFGKSNPAGTGIYIHKASTGQVLLAPVSLRESMDLSLLDLRNRHIVSFDPDLVSLLTLETSGSAPVICEKGEAGWTASSPSILDTSAVDGSRIRSYLSMLADIEAGDIIDNPGDRADYGLGTPELLVSLVETGSGTEAGKQTSRTVRLAVGKEDGRYFVSAGSDRIYELENTDMEIIEADISSFRRTDLFWFDREKTTRIIVDTGESRLVLEKEDEPGEKEGEEDGSGTETVQEIETWRMIEPFQTPAERYPVSRIISSVEYLRVKNFIDDAPDAGSLAGAGLDSPRLSVTFYSPEGILGGVRTGNTLADGEEHYVGTHDGQGIYTVNGYAVENILGAAEELASESTGSGGDETPQAEQ